MVISVKVVGTETTVIAHVAVKPPSCVVTVIVADPAPTPVTRPVEFTVATAVLDELQVTVLFVALAGRTVEVSCCVPPKFIVAVDVGQLLVRFLLKQTLII